MLIGGQPMNVPQPIPYSDIPVAGVFSLNLTQFFFNLGAGVIVDLSTGVQTTGILPTQKWYYFAGAALVIS